MSTLSTATASCGPFTFVPDLEGLLLLRRRRLLREDRDLQTEHLQAVLRTLEELHVLGRRDGELVAEALLARLQREPERAKLRGALRRVRRADDERLAVLR